MIQLHCENRQTIPFDSEWLQQCLSTAIAMETRRPVELTLAFVNDREMQAINREFLEHDWPTDVISFLYSDPEQDPSLEGELILGVETGQREAARFGWSLEAELLLYAVHGFLHLCGYDDLDDAARPQMRQRERELLGEFGLTPRDLQS